MSFRSGTWGIGLAISLVMVLGLLIAAVLVLARQRRTKQ
jgi:hypothetical protein